MSFVSFLADKINSDRPSSGLSSSVDPGPAYGRFYAAEVQYKYVAEHEYIIQNLLLSTSKRENTFPDYGSSNKYKGRSGLDGYSPWLLSSVPITTEEKKKIFKILKGLEKNIAIPETKLILFT